MNRTQNVLSSQFFSVDFSNVYLFDFEAILEIDDNFYLKDREVKSEICLHREV